MNPILQISTLVRFLLTPLLYFTRKDALHTILLLLLLDILDCNPFVISLFPDEYKEKKYCSLDPQYEKLDKSIDSLQYLVALFLLHSVLPLPIFQMSLFFVLYRILGNILYFVTEIKQVNILFFDFVKEYLVLYLLFGADIPNYILIPSLLLKIVYEYGMHQKHFALDLYKKLIE